MTSLQYGLLALLGAFALGLGGGWLLWGRRVRFAEASVDIMRLGYESWKEKEHKRCIAALSSARAYVLESMPCLEDGCGAYQQQLKDDALVSIEEAMQEMTPNVRGERQ